MRAPVRDAVRATEADRAESRATLRRIFEAIEADAAEPLSRILVRRPHRVDHARLVALSVPGERGGASPLGRAAVLGALSCLRVLLESGGAGPQHSADALRSAVLAGQPDSARLLVRHLDACALEGRMQPQRRDRALVRALIASTTRRVDEALALACSREMFGWPSVQAAVQKELALRPNLAAALDVLLAWTPVVHLPGGAVVAVDPATPRAGASEPDGETADGQAERTGASAVNGLPESEREEPGPCAQPHAHE
ncbi:Uncharacterised protein [Burkholderia pseudomallei]|nr:Uncharacterised protein [Burkholderia pseudomallei]VCK72428.1 Uncharacterised protein [Burkholderia pseudomallei]VCK79819.1 Uncharacterised protein [Burkholderia pseudomallei]VCK80184.1 Uncharacterised protein [Burkholderia pseudomallei]VCK80635.1 Uncharacterised protein [Burkholderia pseudomallei]